MKVASIMNLRGEGAQMWEKAIAISGLIKQSATSHLRAAARAGVLLVLVLAGCTANVRIPPVHTATIEISGENRYKALRLTPEIYNAANSDLSDLLIKDGAGEIVPYFINSGAIQDSAIRETYEMALINSYVKDDSFYFDYVLAAERSSDTISTSIEFAARGVDFAKEVDVYGSYDNVHWDYVQRDKIYSIDGKSKLAIEFVRPQKFTHYRLRLANNLEQISFDAVNLVYSVNTSEVTFFIESIKPGFIIESGDKWTTVSIEGLRNLRLCDVTIHSDSMFKRSTSAPNGISTEIYSLSLNGTSYANTTIPLDWQVSQEDRFVITIADGDDRPISIGGITVRYYADDVVFEGEAGGVYTLEFGRDPTKRAPVYDIERYKNDVLQGVVDRVSPGEIEYAEEETVPERDYTLVFNIVIVSVALLLGIVILLKLKKK